MPTAYEHVNTQTQNKIDRVRELMLANPTSEIDMALLEIIERVVQRLDWMDEIYGNN